MEVLDARRLTGPNVIWERPSAVLDVELDEGEEAGILIEAWRAALAGMLEALGWSDVESAVRVFHGGASLAIAGPIDGLYAAIEVNRWAFDRAAAALAGSSSEEEAGELADALARFQELIAGEANPAMRALQIAAAEHGQTFLWDDDEVSLGMGSGSCTWRLGPSDHNDQTEEAAPLPAPDGVDWESLHGVPTALVTGTNGKTTSVRLLASMAAASGQTCGLSSTDWIQVGETIVDRDDWSGPGGARWVLRQKAVDLALLETARGGLLRRGLGVDRADVALITNVAEDHLGEFGVFDMDMLADTKFVVARAAEHLVLNADDPLLVARGLGAAQPITWFSLDPGNPVVQQHLTGGGRACVLKEDELVVLEGGADGVTSQVISGVDGVPISMGGAARHNLANALGAIGVALALGLSHDAIRTGLAALDCSHEKNPGRLNTFDLGGVTALVDFAHNPHGFAAFFAMAAALPARRKAILMGQAGDRTNDAIKGLARAAWEAGPDRVIIKEMTDYLRGREVGAVPELIAAELLRAGASPEQIEHAQSEVDGVRRALAWAEEGDLLCLFTHAQRDEVLDLLASMQSGGWKPGDALPD